MGSKKHRRPRDLPHPESDERRDREFRPGRGLKRTHNRGTNTAKGLPGSRPGRVVRPKGTVPIGAYPPQPPPLLMFHDHEHFETTETEPVKVFGQFPRDLIKRLLPWLRCERHEILHVCSGSLPRGEGVRVDIRPDARPDVLADGRALPFADGTFKAVLIDPPYTEQYARDLYGVDYPTPKSLLAEGARVVRPCGRVALVHFIVANPPPRARMVTVRPFTTGCGFAVRAVTIYEKDQDELALLA